MNEGFIGYQQKIANGIGWRLDFSVIGSENQSSFMTFLWLINSVERFVLYIQTDVSGKRIMNIRTVVTIVSGIYLSNCISFFVHQNEVQCMLPESEIRLADDLKNKIGKLIANFNELNCCIVEKTSFQAISAMKEKTKNNFLKKRAEIKTAMQELFENIASLCNYVNAMVQRCVLEQSSLAEFEQLCTDVCECYSIILQCLPKNDKIGIKVKERQNQTVKFLCNSLFEKHESMLSAGNSLDDIIKSVSSMTISIDGSITDGDVIKSAIDARVFDIRKQSSLKRINELIEQITVFDFTKITETVSGITEEIRKIRTFCPSDDRLQQETMGLAENTLRATSQLVAKKCDSLGSLVTDDKIEEIIKQTIETYGQLIQVAKDKEALLADITNSKNECLQILHHQLENNLRQFLECTHENDIRRLNEYLTRRSSIYNLIASNVDKKSENSSKIIEKLGAGTNESLSCISKYAAMAFKPEEPLLLSLREDKVDQINALWSRLIESVIKNASNDKNLQAELNNTLREMIKQVNAYFKWKEIGVSDLKAGVKEVNGACGNIALYLTQNPLMPPIILQSGLGITYAEDIAKGLIRSRGPALALSGMDVVLAVNSGQLHCGRTVGGYFGAIRSDEGNALINQTHALTEYLKLVAEAENIGSSFPANNAINKDRAIALCTNLLAALNEKAPNADKTTQDLMRVLTELRRIPETDKQKITEALCPYCEGATPADMERVLTWMGQALHTEVQALALGIRTITVVIDGTAPSQILLSIADRGNFYSLFSPCHSCWNLKWVIDSALSAECNFMFALADQKSYEKYAYASAGHLNIYYESTKTLKVKYKPATAWVKWRGL
ncbi:MAG: hypothetical protein LBB25_02945 [Holosporaceae bacterium]|jgi:hypothetical protein|nr:hypothetical protein [Holosporaceae bacterium]